MNEALASLDAEFEALYTGFDRPSIAPERLIRASLIRILFSVRSERQLMEQMQYNLLFRWFVGLGIDVRLAERLLILVGGDREIAATHAQIASELGTAREVISRVLHDFQKRGYIAQSRGRIEVTNKPALRALADSA